MTILGMLVADNTDGLGYTTYVFECLDEEIRNKTKYIMCTRYPNWEGPEIQIGEIGFLSFFEIRAGIDTWYDGNKMIPYRYNNIQFIKFIKKPEKKEHKFTI